MWSVAHAGEGDPLRLESVGHREGLPVDELLVAITPQIMVILSQHLPRARIDVVGMPELVTELLDRGIVDLHGLPFAFVVRTLSISHIGSILSTIMTIVIRLHAERPYRLLSAVIWCIVDPVSKDPIPTGEKMTSKPTGHPGLDALIRENPDAESALISAYKIGSEEGFTPLSADDVHDAIDQVYPDDEDCRAAHYILNDMSGAQINHLTSLQSSFGALNDRIWDDLYTRHGDLMEDISKGVARALSTEL